MPWFIHNFYDISDIVILNIKDADYRCIINRITKNEAINLIQNIDLIKKVEHSRK